MWAIIGSPAKSQIANISTKFKTSRKKIWHKATQTEEGNYMQELVNSLQRNATWTY